MTVPIPLPPPFYGLIDIEANGPHKYFQKTPIAKASSGVTKEMVFESLRRNATPGRRRDVPVSTGDDTDIKLASWLLSHKVTHHVFPEHLTVVNTTVKDKHLLHPGNVFRTVVQEGDDIYVVTRGYGTGLLPRVSERLSPRLWEYTDQAIRDEFNPSTFDRRWGAISNAPPHAARSRLDLSQPPAAESSNPENSRGTFAPPTFNNRWDNLFPAATFDQRWSAVPNPAPQTARSWMDLSQDPAYGNLNPVPAPSQSPQRQEGRRLQDIGVVEPQGQELPLDLPLPRSALAWMNLQNTPLGVLRTAVSPNVPADVWNDVFAGPTFANNGLAAAPDVAGSGGAPVLDAPFEQDPAAPNTNMGAMTSLADLGSGYRNAGLGNSSFGNFADYGTGDFGDYGYGGLERYGIPVR